jgi:PAS domain S-box-containing protein
LDRPSEKPFSLWDRELRRLPRWMTIAVVGLCSAPICLNLLGIHFDAIEDIDRLNRALEVPLDERAEFYYETFTGAFLHSLLEWSAVGAAFFATLFSTLHFFLKRDTASLIIGTALFASGALDALHILIATHLVEAQASYHLLTPFTWTISRVFNSLILTLGVALCILTKTNRWAGSMRFTLGLGLACFTLVFLVFEYSTTVQSLPNLVFPESPIMPRPWDFFPLLVYAFAGLVVFPRFFTQSPSLFSHSIVLSALPQILVQFYMTFGSFAPYDNGYSIAHFLKVVAYLVPLGGLCLDYFWIHLSDQRVNRSLLEEIERRHQVEKQLEESKNRYRLVLDNIPGMVAQFDKDRRYRFVNRQYASFHRLEPQDIVGKKVEEILTPGTYDKVAERMNRALEGEEVEYEAQYEHGDGGRTWFRVVYVPDVSEDNSIQGFYALVHDIEERKRSEENLRRSEELYRRAIEAAGAVPYYLDAKTGGYEFIGELVDRLTGYTREEVTPALIEKVVLEEIPLRTGEGSTEEQGGPLSGREGEERRVDYRIRTKNGSTRWISNAAVQVFDAGKTVGWLGILQDITDRKGWEEELLSRNRELDEFSNMASHDLQEPLRKLISFSQLLASDLGENLNEAARNDLNSIIEASNRMRKLIQDLLALARAGRAGVAVEEVSLDDCVDEALLSLVDRIEKTGAVIERDALASAQGNRVLLTQVYQNLIANSLKFIRENPPCVWLTHEQVGGVSVFGVRDNGIGIDTPYQQQIFVPFRRLHGRDEYEGTGIGLAICKRAVERLGGRMWVESVPGQGSHFRFTLGPSSEGGG